MMIRPQLLVAALMSCSVIGGIGHLAIKNMKNQQALLREIEVEQHAAVVVDKASSAHYDSQVKLQMQKLRAAMTDAGVQTVMSDLIQGYTSHEPRIFEERKAKLLSAIEASSAVKKAALFAEQNQGLELLLATVVMACFGLVAQIALAELQLFKPIKRLSHRMRDFLGDKYSFQFMVPAANEIGHLQKTFNSLAQGVLNNMDELKRLDQSKTDFLNITSHELRTPMTSIKGSLALLSSGAAGRVDESALKLVKIAESESNRLIRLINDLLDLAKIEAGRVTLTPVWFELPTHILTCFEALSGFATQAGVHLQLRTHCGAIQVLADRDRVQQVIINLLSNAIKFSPPGSSVEVNLELDPGLGVKISVKDSGPGLNQDDQKIIFQKFSQGQHGQNRMVSGTGLGLAIVKALIESHEGKVGVHSEPGQGAVFYVTLPTWKNSDRSIEVDELGKVA